MNRDLHNIDDIFNSAHREFEEEPSSDVWDKVNAGLDKKDAERYKRRFIGWKRAAILSLLLLTGFILYESGILKRGAGNQTENVMTKKTDTPATSEKIDKPSNQNSLSHRKNGGSGFDTKEENVADFNTANAAIKKNTQFSKPVEQKTGSLNKKPNATSGRDQTEIVISVS